MAGVSDTPNRRTRRAAEATGTAPAAVAIEASAERAAIERDPGATAGVPASDAPVLPAMDLPDDAAVVPEPTLTAEPGEPAPIVTAAPVLAVEPTALDVVQSQATAARIEAGTATDADREQAHLTAAGQPTIAIEGDAHANFRNFLAMSEEDRLAARVFPDDIVGDGDLLSLDDIMIQLQRLAARDPNGMDIVRSRFFEPAQTVAPAAATADSVTMVEVIGPVQGRRRAGMTFGPEPRRFPADLLSVKEIAALRADPLLTVGVSQVDAIAAYGVR